MATPTAPASCPTTIEATDFFNAVQWAVGLELFLLINDPWRVFFTTDHPNGAPFTAYPDILALLMDRDLRAEWMSRLPKEALEVTTLPSIAREYSLVDIATMTRAAPAKLLGLKDRGHLGAGALADIAVYSPGNDKATMFREAALVFKNGQLVVRDGTVRHAPFGRTLRADPDCESGDQGANAGLLRGAVRTVPGIHDGGRRGNRQAGSIRNRSMSQLTVNGIRVDDTFAEAFGMRATALTITAHSAAWAHQAAVTMTGFATSVIGCGCEAGIDRCSQS